MIIDEKVYLEHVGVKGMKWGVRNKEQTTSDKSTSSHKKLKILGTVAAIAAVTAGALYLKKKLNTKTSLSNISKDLSSGKKFAEEINIEPTTIMHASRGRTSGFRFLLNGGIKDPIAAAEKHGVDFSKTGEYFQRIGKDKDKVFAQFMDPLKRKDQSGRVIPHMVILPKHMSKDVNTLDEAKTKAWPLIKNDFEKIYNTEIRNTLRNH